MSQTFKHKFSKELLVKWLFPSGDYLDYKCSINDFNFNLSWRSNRIFIDYPVVLNKKFNSFDFVWDEHYDYTDQSIIDDAHICTPSPSVDWCKKHKLTPILNLGIAVSHKGFIRFGFIIVDQCSRYRDNFRYKKLFPDPLSDFCLFEISADWILSQTEKPNVLQLLRYITSYQDLRSSHPHTLANLRTAN